MKIWIVSALVDNASWIESSETEKVPCPLYSFAFHIIHLFKMDARPSLVLLEWLRMISARAAGISANDWWCLSVGRSESDNSEEKKNFFFSFFLSFLSLIERVDTSDSSLAIRFRSLLDKQKRRKGQKLRLEEEARSMCICRHAVIRHSQLCWRDDNRFLSLLVELFFSLLIFPDDIFFSSFFSIGDTQQPEVPPYGVRPQDIPVFM